MPNYLRPKVTGATVFFMVNLADRSSSLLGEHRFAEGGETSSGRFEV